MRVALSLAHPARGPAGPRRYGRALAEALRELPQVAVVELPPPYGGGVLRRAWDLVGLGLAAHRQAVDLVHCTGIYAPLVTTRHVVLTVHDLAIRRLPAAFPPLNRWGGWHLWSRLARRADHCIAISEATRRDLVAWAGVPRDRVTVIHHGVGRPFGPVPAAEVMRVRHAGRLHGGYFLAVGTIEPRKNLPRVIEALQVVRSSGSEAQLVVVGAPGWGQTRLQQQLLSGALGPSVRYVGHVPDADLAALYAGAIALVYPSLYEGFGLPILEAMACGCPVITSACGGLAEAAGDAARRVDPRSVPDIAAAMQALLVEPSQRTELARRGQQRATNFTWQRTAEHTLAVYRHVLETAHA